MLTPTKSEQRIADELRYIGAPVARPNALRLLQGRGVYVDDIVLPRMVHVVYWRSPIAHGRITSFDASFATMMPGVIGVFGAEDIADICTPWVGTLAHLPGMKSPPQYPLARGHLCWQGEPVFAVVAETRHQAEDDRDGARARRVPDRVVRLRDCFCAAPILRLHQQPKFRR